MINDLRQWQNDARLNTRVRRLAGDAADEIERLQASNGQMRTALTACRQHVRQTYGSWWNNREACDLMTKHINPALGLDPWAGG